MDVESRDLLLWIWQTAVDERTLDRLHAGSSLDCGLHGIKQQDPPSADLRCLNFRNVEVVFLVGTILILTNIATLTQSYRRGSEADSDALTVTNTKVADYD